MEYVYHMRDPKQALLFLQDLDRQPFGILDIGVVFLMSNGVTDWYVFVNADQSLGRELEELLGDRGQRSEYNVDQLRTHPDKSFMCSGTYDQILDGLDAIGETQREFHKQRIQAKAKLN